jgi:hypothetical protein
MEFVLETLSAMCRNIARFAFVAMDLPETLSLVASRSDADQTVNALQQKLASTKNAQIHASTLNVDEMQCAKLITTIKHVAIVLKATVEIL